MYTISLFLFYVFPQVSCLVELLEDFLLTIFSHLILSDINIQFTKSKCGFLVRKCLQVCCQMCSLHIEVHQKLNTNATNEKPAIDTMPSATMLQSIPPSRHLLSSLSSLVLAFSVSHTKLTHDTYRLT